MKKYFIRNNDEQLGPYDLEELKDQGVKPETPIWYEGLDDWTTVDQINELKGLFTSPKPPPYKAKSDPPAQKPTTPPKKKKKSKGGWVALIIVIVVMLGVWFAYQAANNSGGSYYQQKMSIEEMERANPTQFLDATGHYRENFWGDKINVDCEVINSATVASYKDVVIVVTYYSKTDSKIGTDTHTLYEIFPPNTTTTVELKINNYKDVASISWDVVSAKSYYGSK